MTGDRKAGPNGHRILVVEDEFLIADDIAASLEELGYAVVGPTASVGGALALIREGSIEAALLDANLDGEGSGPIADELSNRGIPFVVVTGYGERALENDRLQRAPRVTKPFATRELADRLSSLLSQFG